MRIKNFTLILMAVLFSAVGFAQKPTLSKEALAINRLAKVVPAGQTKGVQKLAKQSAVMAGLSVNSKDLPASVAADNAPAYSPAKAAGVVTPPEDGEMEYFTLTGQNSKGSGTTTRTVKVIFDANDEDIVYVSGLSWYLPNAYVQGIFSKEGDQVIFAAGQYMGDAGADIYFGAYSQTGLVDAVADYDELTGTFTFTDDVLLDNSDPKEIGFYSYWKPGVVISPVEGAPDIPVEIPKDLEYEEYVATAFDYFEDDADYSNYVNVGFYGTIGEGCDVYIQGMSTDVPEAWIKGTFVNDSTVAFASGQMLDEDLYFVAIDADYEVVENYILIYDAETGNFTEDAYAPMINEYKDRIDHSVYQFCYSYEIKKIVERAATPVLSNISSIRFTPSADELVFNLAKVDTDNEGLLKDLLSYRLYYIDEKGNQYPVTFSRKEYTSLTTDLTEIPASLNDGTEFMSGSVALNQLGHRSWTEIGIQAIYTGGGETNESEIAWYTPTWPISVTLPEGLTVTEHTFSGELYDSDGNTPFERTVGIAVDGDDLYIRGLGETDETVWVKGTKNAEGAYVFQRGQTLGTYASYYPLFLVGLDGENVADVVVTEDATKFTITSDFLENAYYTDRSYYLNRFVSDAIIYKAEAGTEVPELVEVPEDLETEPWLFKATDYFDEVAVARTVNVGFYDDEVYVQGISEILPEAWVKGIVEENEDGETQVRFASGQYLGTYRGYDIWFIGYNMNRGITSYVMDFDEENQAMTNPSEDLLIGINTYKAKVSASLYEFYFSSSIKKIVERAATPVTPYINHMNYSVYGDIAEFSIPTMDTDGEGLVDSLVSYKIYYDEGDGEAKELVFTTDYYEKLTEDMTVIPYGFHDSFVTEDGELAESYDFGTNWVYLNQEEVETWSRIGIQTIYTGGGETNVSEIGWHTPFWPVTTELPDGAEVATYTFSGSTVEGDSIADFSRNVNVAFVDDEVYIQGIGTVDAEAWVKGTKNPDTNVYTFARGQRLGLLALSSSYDYLFLMGYTDLIGEVDVRMSYDEETGALTAMTEIVENADYTDNLYYWNRINAGAVIAPIPDVPATPAAPSIEGYAYSLYGDIVAFDVPTEDVDGNALIESKLSYKFYSLDAEGNQNEVTFTTDDYEKLTENMTEIPYGFTDEWDIYDDMIFINMEHSDWVSIGIQSIYTGGDETNVSEISWYNIIPLQFVTVPDDAEILDYGFQGTNIYTQADYSIDGVKVAFDGDDVYIQGANSVNNEAWIKGTKDENGDYVFSFGQCLGIGQDEDGYYPVVFLAGYDSEVGFTEFKLSYDEESGVFTALTYLIENADFVDTLSLFDAFIPGARIIPAGHPDAISTVDAQTADDSLRFNVAGQLVGKNYKGIVLKNNKKLLQK